MAEGYNNGITYDTTTFKVLCTCYALLALKMLLMAPLTIKHQCGKKTGKEAGESKGAKGQKAKYNDVDAERVRRAHQNDLENIIVFINIAFWYTALKPNPLVAIPLIISYTLARFAHTYVYAIKVVRQPARFLCYGAGYVITGYMAVNVMLAFKD